MNARIDQPLLLDGAMGSLLAERGGDTRLPLWSARALIDAPETVRQIHLDYLRAGARVSTTNTFRTHRRSLARAHLGEHAGHLTRLAVDLARQACGSFRRDAPKSGFPLIAGGISPLEDCYRPDLAPGYDAALPEHREIARTLADAGADLLLVETMPAWPEAHAALTAALETNLPVWFSLHTGTPGVLLSGENLAVRLAELDQYPAAVLVNCIPADRASEDARFLRGHVPEHIPVGIYANSGHIDPVHGWSIENRISPARYADLAATWVDAGARIIGGCCGTTPAHIAAVRARLGHEDHLRA